MGHGYFRKNIPRQQRDRTQFFYAVKFKRLQYEAFRALAFAGFALFTGLALVIVGMTASAEVFSSPDTYLLRDMIKTTLTVRVVKYEIPKISPTAALRMARRPAHITGRSPLAVDKQRGRLPPNHFPSGQ